MNLEFYKNTLEKSGVKFDSGLTEKEISAAEKRYQFRLPPDLREFLMFALPVSRNFINWRDIDDPNIKETFERVYGGIILKMSFTIGLKSLRMK